MIHRNGALFNVIRPHLIFLRGAGDSHIVAPPTVIVRRVTLVYAARPADSFVPISLPAGPPVWVDFRKRAVPVPVVQQFAQPSPEFSPWTKRKIFRPKRRPASQSASLPPPSTCVRRRKACTTRPTSMTPAASAWSRISRARSPTRSFPRA
ncbi:hypothetical protein CBM2637_A210135 [Cupriavidus taiwanensis]|nr:hypothetical protein CBM2637_A210135 [Cupriavidus taiwanensis]